MSDLENIDDELLSAFLDDELSTEERASVEARLAADPAARQMLEQLRAVSQVMHGLPHETVGRDLRDTILRRVEQAERTARVESSAEKRASRESSNGAAGRPRQLAPKFTIGRSPRGWIWAAMAVAAALLIMVFQPKSGDDIGNRQVALQRAPQEDVKREIAADRFGVEAAKTTAGAPGAVSSAATPPSDLATTSTRKTGAEAPPSEPPSGSIAGAPTEQSTLADSKRLDEVSKNAAAGNRRPATSSPTAPATASAGGGARNTSESTVSRAAAPAGTSTFGGGIAATATTDSDSSGAAPPADDNQLVVVRVLAKPEALRNKSFDRLLGDNGIQVEEPPNEADKNVPGQLAAKSTDALASTDEQKQSRQPADEPQSEMALGSQLLADHSDDVDVVLVEAPSATITSCLSGLNKDKANYLGISVVDESAAIGDAAAAADNAKELMPARAKIAPVKQRAVELGWAKDYNRGVVPTPQEEARERTKFYYYSDVSRGESARGGGLAGRGDTSGPSQSPPAEGVSDGSLEFKNSNYGTNGRAWRALPEELGDRRGSELLRRRGVTENESETIERGRFVRSGRQLDIQSAADGDRLQVLFILSAGSEPNAPIPAAAPPATSPAAPNRAE